MTRVFLFVLLIAGATPVSAQIPDAPPPSSFAPTYPCQRVTDLSEEALGRLGRFAALPEHFESWRQRSCWPAHLDDERLRRAPTALGAVIDVDGHDAFVVEIDPDWIRRCPERRGLRPRLTRITGSDWMAVKSRIAAEPGLGSLDILEIGFSRAEAGETNFFALYLGTRDRAARVECFEDFGELLDQAARAFSGAASR